MNEERKYVVIKKLVETNGNKKRASIELNCTVRHINRLIVGYKRDGKAFFIHKNRGSKPSHAFSNDLKHTIVDLYLTKYWGTNFTHYSELLAKHENIIVSPSAITVILAEKFILSPKANRSTKKKFKEKLELLKKDASKKETTKIENQIIDIEDAHPRRPRCAYFGEMVQMDASLHLWFGYEKTQLHIAIDDCTGSVLAAHFDTQETLKGYYNILYQILNNHGIPYMFFTDRRTVFEYKQKKSPKTEEDTFTQFSYACNQLGVEIKTSSIPESKGRVERLFQTLQSRLPIELRLAGVTTIEEANEFLNHYIKEFNSMFALPIDYTDSVFEKQPEKEKINLTLSIITIRKIDKGHSIRFNKKYYRHVNSNGYPVYYAKGTSCTVIQAFDGQLFSCVGESIYSLEEIPEQELESKNLDFAKTEVKPKARYVPPMSHPWKQQSFERFLKKQKHRTDKVAS